MATCDGSLTRSLLSPSRSSWSGSRVGFGSTSSSYRPVGRIAPPRVQCSRSLFTSPRTVEQSEVAPGRTSFQIPQLRTFIQTRTVLNVEDNSGAIKVMCIQALKGKKRARLGETIVVSVKRAKSEGKVKKGNVCRAVVVHATMKEGHCDGSKVKFDNNARVLVDEQGQPIGTRVFGLYRASSGRRIMSRFSLAEHIV